MAAAIAELEHHPHAQAVLEGALAADAASHAYLLHGPAGTGKRAAAREFAARLLAAGEDDAGGVAGRARRDAHPDLTWVRPSGAAALVVADIDDPVVAAATRTPFEASRRIFVIEGADLMNDEAANRLLKTLEEPAPYVHIILIADRPDDLPATIRSRCQPVRFDPLSAQALAAGLDAEGHDATSAARLALGDGGLARLLVSEPGRQLRAAAGVIVAAALEPTPALRPAQPLLDLAAAAGEANAGKIQSLLDEQLPLVPRREQAKMRRELEEAAKRGQRRDRTALLQSGLRLVELAFRDMLCIREGAGEVVYAVDLVPVLAEQAERVGVDRLAEAIELVDETRASLRVNVGEELALEALVVRLREALA
jgi:DNA polymerase-3 subunit delta'